MSRNRLLQALSIILCILSFNVFSAQILVSDQDEYHKALKQVSAGDTIILADGTWENFEITFKGQGKPNQPITLTAQTKGKVILSGKSNLRLAGEHLVVSGLVFKDGFTPTNAVIAYRINKETIANNSRVTEVVIENYSNPDRDESDYWVSLYGKNNRFDHSYLAGKRNRGVTMAVRLDSKASQENHHLIDNNYFGPRPIFGSNGGETLRIGTSHFSLTNSYTRVENNYFDRCNGEVEIISVKSGKNEIRNNVFFESRGTLTLRHGNGNLVENNVFFGNGVDHTGGIRVINRDQIVRNNYLEGLTGTRFGSAFTIMNGVPNSSINRYHQVVNANISNNTFINIDNVNLAAGSDKERSAPPIETVIKNNLFYSDNKTKPASVFNVFDDISGISFQDNLVQNINTDLVNRNSVSKAFQSTDIRFVRDGNGLLIPQGNQLKQVGASNLNPIKKSEVGPVWYAKNELETPFDSGNIIHVKPTPGALINAVNQAADGDILLLEPGHYIVEKIIDLDKTLTIKASKEQQVKITFYRSTLFAINNYGSLKLSGLRISGEDSPDSAGNVLVRTAKWGMLVNYRFLVENSVIENLDVNHSFHFFDAGSRSFARIISITNTEFNNITGDILRLNKEIDDLGIYNAEYIVLKDNRVKQVSGALANVYRGGTDESTFGPHFIALNNQISTVGKGKRNKSQASITLHGVQVTNIENNKFYDSANIVIEHTVGEPKTAIINNQFKATAAPKVSELFYQGDATAVLKDNQIL